MSRKPPILVCGTGIAGLAAGLGLAKAGFGVTQLGPRPEVPAASTDAYHPRVYAISASSQEFLAQLGVWDLMDARRITAVEGMQVHGDGDGVVTLHAWQAAQLALAWIVESSELERVLQQALRVFGVTWHTEKFHGMERGHVITEGGLTLEADLVVGADGAQSAVRVAAGIAHESRAYGDMGLVVHLNAGLPHGNMASQWFTGDTVLALLPMPDTADGPQVSMVWSMPDGMAKDLLAMPEDKRNPALESRLAAITGDKLGRLSVRSPIFGFPLFLEKSAMVAPGVALVGDAAHRIHPLAGQGLNLGLADVRELIDTLVGREAWRPVGDIRVLNRYRRGRAEPALAMRLATDGLYRLFGMHAAPVAWARNLGMAAVDRLPFVKRRLIQEASGR